MHATSNLQDGTACFVTLLEMLFLIILDLLVCFSDLFAAILLYVKVGLTLFAPIVMVTDPTNQSSVPLVRHDLSDLGSEILIRILPKERTLSFHALTNQLKLKHFARISPC